MSDALSPDLCRGGMLGLSAVGSADQPRRRADTGARSRTYMRQHSIYQSKSCACCANLVPREEGSAPLVPLLPSIQHYPPCFQGLHVWQAM